MCRAGVSAHARGLGELKLNTKIQKKKKYKNTTQHTNSEKDSTGCFEHADHNLPSSQCPRRSFAYMF